MAEEYALCPVCERPVWREVGRGRPRIYCDPQCRRQANGDRRRLRAARRRNAEDLVYGQGADVLPF